jgi:hypothetical protein
MTWTATLAGPEPLLLVIIDRAPGRGRAKGFTPWPPVAG